MTVFGSSGTANHSNSRLLIRSAYQVVPNQLIMTAQLAFLLDHDGLSLDYNLYISDLRVSYQGPHSPGWLQGKITLPWETLILRYPFLVHERVRFLAIEGRQHG